MYMGFTPGTTAATGGGLSFVSSALSSVIPGASLVSGLISTIGRLFGSAPRGELQKFQRTLYPYMRTAAAQSGISVYCYWFGEIVQVKPDGSYAAIRSNLYLADAERIWEEEIPPPFYIARCYRSDGDCVNNPGDIQFNLFDPYGQAEVILPPGAASTGGDYVPSGGYVPPGGVRPVQASLLGGNTLLWLVLGGAAIYVISSGSPKRRR